jgi:hypothetical protein
MEIEIVETHLLVQTYLDTAFFLNNRSVSRSERKITNV